jgi:KaiC/GvpD/RAD55 family RecA-like ATPase
MSQTRVVTGAGGLDSMIQGGFPKGSLIILAGGPGSGKTAFGSAFICEGVEKGEIGAFISLTEDKESFSANTTDHFGPRCMEYFLQGKADFLGIETLTEGGAPAILASILQRVEEKVAKCLIIDDFSILSQAAKDRTELRGILQTIVSRIVRMSKCATILTVEIPSNQKLIESGLEELWADGIIKLSREQLDGRLLRKMEIVKLRGTRLPEREFIFTLEGGFKVFETFKLKPIVNPQRFSLVPDQANSYSSGAEDLDIFLGGGYPKGSMVLLEVGSGVTIEEYQMIIAPSTWNFMAQARGSIMVPSSGVDYHTLRILLRIGGFTEKETEGRGKVVVLGSTVIPEDPILVPFEGRSQTQDYQQFVNIASELKSKLDQPICYTIGYDALIAHYGIEAVINQANFEATRVRETGDLCFAIVKPGYEGLSEKLGSVTNIHLKLIVEDGVLLLYGIKPRTNLYAVEMDTSKGYPLPRLTPIV